MPEGTVRLLLTSCVPYTYILWPLLAADIAWDMDGYIVFIVEPVFKQAALSNVAPDSIASDPDPF
jgi:hypothetical protein